ncbi:MAG: GDP-mannose 4,6-dehydratase [Candidatus Marinimicrobia bacterium]|jgi:GDPmannose 4,6-dehydratase|nr:GDP-mannose 4,6-dehydratase [Candidatus Neomarinimicrobiota bacterium]MBT3840127.1 GDP-mannose 4,6-dehydratase [Candidatus Neomarinimicrobiota bacterium]MBT4069569.1 GDP-mannose 4,6-dehydratase [Candidatus Neomarinimicrobiota bacterium]MBT4280474.1 GDP-mannose 4,6-dehydratase [Candidatus Neomarinimicrobiota bacterium]MBT4956413.1 GDP-mannose 4,6-dehydratase [Candidatus Neomarinimicrobiota bacterium]
MKKTALITGISGQDGAYLSKFLLENGYRVIGGDRRTSRGSLWRLEELGIRNDIELINFELSELTNIYRTIEKFEFDEIYNLAAQSFVAASFELPTMTADVTALGVCRILEGIRNINPKIKFYQASSSEMFGKALETPQNENTPFYPRSPYAVSKLFGHWIAVNYRESYEMFTVSGILFNHESPLRGEEFVTRKITSSLAKIKTGTQNVLELGNLDAKRDWGFSGDFVKGMWQMMQHDVPDEYVLATGTNFSVRDFVNAAAPHFGFDLMWEGKGIEERGIDRKTNTMIIKINPKFFRPADVVELLGNPSKAKAVLGWEPEVSFEELVEMMSESDLRKFS